MFFLTKDLLVGDEKEDFKQKYNRADIVIIYNGFSAKTMSYTSRVFYKKNPNLDEELLKVNEEIFMIGSLREHGPSGYVVFMSANGMGVSSYSIYDNISGQNGNAVIRWRNPGDESKQKWIKVSSIERLYMTLKRRK